MEYKEIWRDIPGFEGYQASNTKQIRSVDRIIMRKANGGKIVPYHFKGKIISQSNNPDGYPQITIHKRKVSVHKLVALAFPEICGKWFEGCEVDHIDRNKENNVPENLRWVYHIDNMQNVSWNNTYGGGNKKRHRKYSQEQKARKAVYNKEYSENNKDKILKRKKNYYAENKETILLKKKAYYTEHREEIRAKQSAYYKKKKGLV